MKRLVWITLFLLSSGPAYAEWVKVGFSQAEGSSTYVDPGTIRRNGALVKIWYLLDSLQSRTVQQSQYLSQKAQAQIDCAEERMRVLTFTNYSGNMGNGNVVYTNNDESEWTAVAPGTVGEVLWNFACGKKERAVNAARLEEQRVAKAATH
jgi:surface-adhesin protein E